MLHLLQSSVSLGVAHSTWWRSGTAEGRVTGVDWSVFHIFTVEIDVQLRAELLANLKNIFLSN